jgi:hypothetical protein
MAPELIGFCDLGHIGFEAKIRLPFPAKLSLARMALRQIEARSKSCAQTAMSRMPLITTRSSRSPRAPGPAGEDASNLAAIARHTL